MGKQLLFFLAASLLFTAGLPNSELVKKDNEKLHGTWAVIAMESDGVSLPEEKVKAASLQIILVKDKLIHKQNGKIVNEATYRINPTAKPKSIDTIHKNGTVELGIYLLEEDRLTICTSTKTGGQRPLDFVTKADSGHILFKLKREKP